MTFYQWSILGFFTNLPEFFIIIVFNANKEPKIENTNIPPNFIDEVRFSGYFISSKLSAFGWFDNFVIPKYTRRGNPINLNQNRNLLNTKRISKNWGFKGLGPKLSKAGSNFPVSKSIAS